MSSAEGPIVIAPFANERVREWPLVNFRRFVELILADGRSVKIVGTTSQRARANELVRGFPAPDVVNVCGRTSWAELNAAILLAPFVVANNSGVAHLTAKLGQWLLCVFAGGHSWAEWMPRGPRVVTVARMVSCAPCEIGDGICPHSLACLAHLEPEVAYKLIEARRAAQLLQAA